MRLLATAQQKYFSSPNRIQSWRLNIFKAPMFDAVWCRIYSIFQHISLFSGSPACKNIVRDDTLLFLLPSTTLSHEGRKRPKLQLPPDNWLAIMNVGSKTNKGCLSASL